MIRSQTSIGSLQDCIPDEGMVIEQQTRLTQATRVLLQREAQVGDLCHIERSNSVCHSFRSNMYRENATTNPVPTRLEIGATKREKSAIFHNTRSCSRVRVLGRIIMHIRSHTRGGLDDKDDNELRVNKCHDIHLGR